MEDKIELKEGEEFAVALSLCDSEGRFWTYLDNHVSNGSKSYSYLGGWKELELDKGNCRIKVYTKDIPPEAISSIEVTDIANPVFRQFLDREAVCRTEGIETAQDQVSVVWKDGETELAEDAKAGVGVAYTASVTLTAKEGYYFFEDLIVKFQNTLVSQENIKRNSDNKTLTMTYTYKPIEEIKSVELTELALPEGGKNLSMQITCNNEEVEEIAAENIIWKKEEEPVSGKAEYHTVYSIAVTLRAKEGYAFTDDTTVTLNSDSAETFCSEDGKDLTVTYTFPITPRAKLLEDIVSSITVDGIANGTKKTVEDLGLPKEIAVKTEDEAVKWVTIVWDLENPDDPVAYDPTVRTEQVFQVNGKADFESILIDTNDKSDVITATITVSAAEIAGAPVPDKIAGVYTENQTVRLTSSSEGASIYYVLDETKDPLESGIKYTDPILLEGIKGESKVIIIKAVAVREDMRDSSIVTFQYTINLPEQEYNITVINDGNGTASASTDHAKAGEEITLEAAANTGYHFKEWTVTSGSAVIVNNSFVMPKEDIVVHAAFEKNKSSKPSSSSSSSSSSGSSSETKTVFELSSDLTSEEQRLVNNILGSNTKVQTVIKCSTGKLVISSNQEVVFCENNKTLSQNKWQKVEQNWYYFGADNKAVKGWLWNNNKWYFMNSNNKKMETGWLKTADGKWYLLDKLNGDMKSGWQFVNGKWYYLDLVNGDMKTGWIKWNGQWYYLSSSGEMLTDTVTPDGYIVDKDGVWIS